MTVLRPFVAAACGSRSRSTRRCRFRRVDGDDELDASFSVLSRDGDQLFSPAIGDGVFGSVVVVMNDDVDALFRTYRERVAPGKSGLRSTFTRPIDQSWGTREFVGSGSSTLRFTQGQPVGVAAPSGARGSTRRRRPLAFRLAARDVHADARGGSSGRGAHRPVHAALPWGHRARFHDSWCSFFGNSLSDLGSTVAWGGQANTVGAMLFTCGFCLVAIGCGACAVAMVHLYRVSASTRQRAALQASGCSRVRRSQGG